MVKMLIVLVSTISNSQVFLLKKIRVAFANYFFFFFFFLIWVLQNIHIFSAKILAYMPFNDQSFNNMLINDIVSFEQLGPEV